MALPTREELRKRMMKKQAERTSRMKDPDEFRVPKVAGGEKLVYYFRVLPELEKGDKCVGGTCDVASELWFYANGAHWLNKQKHECPRMHDGNECEMCKLGWDLLEDEKDEDVRKKVIRQYMPRSGYAMNIYFLNIKNNPENLRGKVMWYNAPITVWKPMDACIANEDAGSEVDPHATGIFYHPYEGGYTFKLTATKKGDWNNYESECGFLAKSFGPLVSDENGKPNNEAIQAILDKRHVLQNKFPARNADKIAEIVKKIESPVGEGEAEGEEGVEDIQVAEGANEVKRQQQFAKQQKPAVVEEFQESPKTRPAGKPVEVNAETNVASREQVKSEQKPKQAAAAAAAAEEDAVLEDLLSQIKGNKK